MKVHDKYGFIESIVGMVLICILNAIASFINGSPIDFKPSYLIVMSTLVGIYESISPEKSKMNIEARLRKKEIMEKEFGKKASLISNSVLVALLPCLVVMGVNFGLGLVMIIITLCIHNIIIKPVKRELQKIEKDAQRKKKAIW